MFVYLILRVRQLIEKPGKPQCFLKTDSTAVVLGKAGKISEKTV
jgi:hypothetical protein